MRPGPEFLLTEAQARTRPLRMAYIPHEDMGNAYTDRMRELMARFGSVERFAGFRRLLRGLPWSLQLYDAVIVNWTENAIVGERSGRIALRGAARVFLRALLMRAFARRLIFVRHNNYPHGTAAGREGTARRIIDGYERLFDAVVTHSGAAAGTRRIYCPHPLYRPADAPGADEAIPPLPEDYFLAFGRITPYKRLEHLIEAFPRHRRLVVAGAVGDAAYVRRLEELRRENLILLPGRIAEADAQSLVRGARAMVIAHAEADMVVSASFFYALSFGCPVYAVGTPFLAWVRPRIGNGLLHLGGDLEQLCALIANAGPGTASPAALAAVRQEFGDHAIVTALAGALGLRP